MNVSPLEIPDVLLIEPRIHRDSRGHFIETFSARRYADAGIMPEFVQDNLSLSRRGVVRGLHLQVARPQGKLVTAVSGEVFDVAVDVRSGSPTFGRWVATVLSAANGRQLYVPEGFAHGFATLSEEAVVVYKCTDYYDPAAEITVRWNDAELAIRWPVEEPILSERDRVAPRLRDHAAGALPVYGSRP